MLVGRKTAQNHSEHPHSGSQSEDTVYVERRSNRRAVIVAAIVVIALLAGATFVAMELPSIEAYFGPAPTWHSFAGVFDNQGQLATESCSLQNLGPGPLGIGTLVTAETTVVCTYHGASYVGYYLRDCNLKANGPAYSINGEYIPFDGCILSTLPMNSIFHGLFTLSDKTTNGTIQVYSNLKVVANMTPSNNWKDLQCSLATNNITKTNGPMGCTYMGTPYVSLNILQDCNFGTPIQVNGVPVPQDSCSLQRSEVVTG